MSEVAPKVIAFCVASAVLCDRSLKIQIDAGEVFGRITIRNPAEDIRALFRGQREDEEREAEENEWKPVTITVTKPRGDKTK